MNGRDVIRREGAAREVFEVEADRYRGPCLRVAGVVVAVA
jgi:hypothetical protein